MIPLHVHTQGKLKCILSKLCVLLSAPAWKGQEPSYGFPEILLIPKMWKDPSLSSTSGLSSRRAVWQPLIPPGRLAFCWFGCWFRRWGDYRPPASGKAVISTGGTSGRCSGCGGLSREAAWVPITGLGHKRPRCSFLN